MLTSLRIKNLGLVDDLTWELDSGYNVVTGDRRGQVHLIRRVESGPG